MFSAFRESPNILNTLEVLAGPMDDTLTAMETYLDSTALEDREGVLLDWAGWLIGVPRPPAQEDDENLLWLCALDEMDIEVESRGLSTLDEDTGGYMTGMWGIESQTNPGSFMSDDDYRELIETKAWTFRKKATLGNRFEMLLRFGMRVVFTEGTAEITYTPESFDSANYWKRHVVTQKYFKPAGIKLIFSQQTEPEEGL